MPAHARQPAHRPTIELSQLWSATINPHDGYPTVNGSLAGNIVTLWQNDELLRAFNRGAVDPRLLKLQRATATNGPRFETDNNFGPGMKDLLRLHDTMKGIGKRALATETMTLYRRAARQRELSYKTDRHELCDYLGELAEQGTGVHIAIGNRHLDRRVQLARLESIDMEARQVDAVFTQQVPVPVVSGEDGQVGYLPNRGVRPELYLIQN